MTKEVYSEFEVIEQQVIFTDENIAHDVSCVGTSKETVEVKSVVKKCRGVEAKRKSKIIGASVEVAAHIPKAVYEKMLAMKNDELKEGVSGYNSSGKFASFCLTQKVLDEDDVVKYKAYPNCILTEGPERAIDNSAEEVAELTLKIKAMKDEYDFFTYEALADELDDETAAAWMESFTPELVRNSATTQQGEEQGEEENEEEPTA